MGISRLSNLERDVLNATADDAENLEQIYKSLQTIPSPVTLTEIAETMRELIAKGWLKPRADEAGRPVNQPDDPTLIWRGWFEMTTAGRDTFDARKRESSPIEDPDRRSRLGAWKDIAVDIPLETFQKNRQELWGDKAAADRE